ncbi:MAG TPA: DivIVA domain-containing protein [Cyclobacteriaceae bacterium]|nr:DivIVA domain-containing protein [Cyclobacteriaceae bacterium]
MRITPLEIRQKSFEKHFRGYDRDEVDGFLMTLSQEWERLNDECKELRIKLEATEREVSKLREVEGSLYKTLKTAEDTGASVIEQARTAADLHLKESQLKAEAIVNEAKNKARDMIEEADVRARQIVEDMEERLKSLIDDYKRLETSREDLIAELRRMANDALDRVERARSFTADFNPDKFLSDARRDTRSIIYPNGEYVRAARGVTEGEAQTPAEPESPPAQTPVETETPPAKTAKSFFDTIE